MHLVGVCRVQANHSHFCGGLVHFGGKPGGGFGPWSIFAGSNVVLFGRVRSILAGKSYVIHCTSEFNRHRQTDNI
jgi:hypothetical protein